MRALPRSLGISLAALLLVALYRPTLSAEGLWDDNYFIFWRYSFNPLPALSTIWSAHFWPMYDTVAVGLYRWWGHHYTYWRVLNLALHFGNALALAWLVARWRPHYFWPMLLAFLIHPLNVMSVAFIIQLKTLLCMAFLLIAVALVWWGEEQRRRWPVVLAALSFFCSVTAKSASLPFPMIALVGLVYLRELNSRRFLRLLPFLLISVGMLWRVSADDVLRRRTELTETQVVGVAPITEAPAPIAPAAEPLPNPITEVSPAQRQESVKPSAPVSTSEPAALTPPKIELPPVTEPAPAIETAPTIEATPQFGPAPLPALPVRVVSRWQLVLHNFGAYVSYPLWPWPLSLAHGRFSGAWSLRAIAGLLCFGALLGLALWRRQRSVGVLALSYAIALAPFLGFVIAPYMSYTAISEQHLYLVLPIALVLFLMLSDRLERETRQTVLAAGLVALTCLTTNYVSSYTSEEALFQRVIAERPMDLFAHVNLAGFYRRIGHYKRAEIVLRNAAQIVETNPELRREPAYQIFLTSWEQYGL